MKNTIKKALSLVLACMLVMSMSAIAVLAEGDAVTIAMGYVTGEAGQQVVVPVTIGADSNVASGSFAIDFDSTQLTFIEATEGTVALSYYEVGVTADNANQIGVAFIGEDLGAVDAAGGTLFNLVFLVNASATEPVTELAFNFEAVRDTDVPGLFDAENTELTYQATNGTVVTGATADVMLSLGNVTGAVGETVSVPLTITADTYVVSGAFTVAYDSSALAFVDYTAGNIAEVTQVEVDAVADGASEVGVIFSTQNTATPITAAGTIVYINFEILEGAANSSALTINLVHPTDATANGGVATADGDVTDAVFLGGAVEITEAPVEPTTTTVTFNVTPADATVDFNGEVKTAVDGVATFENVEFGTLAYTVSKEGYISQNANIEVVADMAAIEVVLEAEAVEPDPEEPPVSDVPVPTVTSGHKNTHEVTYDAATQTITGRAYSDYTNITYIAVRIEIDGAAAKDITLTNNTTSMKKSGALVYAYKENGLVQNATIKYKDYEYNLVMEFVDDPTCVNLEDILLYNVGKVVSVTITPEKKLIVLQEDRYKLNVAVSTVNIGVKGEEGSTVTYRYDNENSYQTYDPAKNDGFYASANSAKSYTSYYHGDVGRYGAQKMRTMKRAQGTNYAYATITKGDYSTEYAFEYNARDFAYDAKSNGVDVSIESYLTRGVFTDSIVIDNDAKTIYFEASLQAPKGLAGIAVEVNNGLKTRKSRPRFAASAVSGFGLSTSNSGLTDAQIEKYGRYVLTKKASALASDDMTYTYEMLLCGGEDGLANQKFTVTVKWIDAPLP